MGLLSNFKNPFAGGGLLSDPMVRLQMGAAMMGGQTLGDQFGGGLMAAGQAGQARKQKMDEQAKQNKTLEFLRNANPELAQAVEAGALDPVSAYKMHLDAQKPKTPNFQEVGGQLYFPDTGKWLAPPADPNAPANMPKYGMNPVLMQGPDGITVGQLSDGNQLSPSKMPDGYKVLSPYDKSLQTNVGKGDAAMVQALPMARQTATKTMALVDDLVADPALAGAVGPIQGRLPSFREGSIRVDTKIAQLKGRAFLEARQMLKGGGQITDYEGARAENAMVRMEQAQNEDDFKAALLEFKDAVQQGLAKMENAAAQGGSMQNFGGGNEMSPAGNIPFKVLD